jgi:hypothetical protein
MSHTGTVDFFRLARNPAKFRLFLLAKLPAAYFSGVHIREIDTTKCVVGIRYKWFNRNPFRSTYFACLSMAAELSTGALAMAHLYKRKPTVSMLVTKVESEYFKKATSLTLFTCLAGEEIKTAIEESIQTGEPRIVRARSEGRSPTGELEAEFYVTWSFKARR